MAEYEENGNFYIEKTSIEDPDGRVVQFYEVGQIIEVNGTKRYKPSSDFSAKTREEAIEWIEAQG